MVSIVVSASPTRLISILVGHLVTMIVVASFDVRSSQYCPLPSTEKKNERVGWDWSKMVEDCLYSSPSVTSGHFGPVCLPLLISLSTITADFTTNSYITQYPSSHFFFFFFFFVFFSFFSSFSSSSSLYLSIYLSFYSPGVSLLFFLSQYLSLFVSISLYFSFSL